MCYHVSVSPPTTISREAAALEDYSSANFIHAIIIQATSGFTPANLQALPLALEASNLAAANSSECRCAPASRNIRT